MQPFSMRNPQVRDTPLQAMRKPKACMLTGMWIKHAVNAHKVNE